MRKIDIILISVFVLLSVPLIVKDEFRNNSAMKDETPTPVPNIKVQKDLPESHKHSLAGRISPEGKFTISQFKEGLPQEFWPQDLSRFSDLEKLEEDLHYRKLRMYEKFREEQEAFKRQKGPAFDTDIDWRILKESIRRQRENSMISTNLSSMHSRSIVKSFCRKRA